MITPTFILMGDLPKPAKGDDEQRPGEMPGMRFQEQTDDVAEKL